MKSLLLDRALLILPEVRQTSVTQSQKESWLRLMERERSSQFASISAAESGKTENSVQPFVDGGQQESQEALANGMPGGGREVSGLPAASLFREGLLPITRGGYATLDSAGKTVLSPSCPFLAQDERGPGGVLDGVSAGVGASFLERLLRQHWPRANLLVAKDADGLRIWLRDPDLLEDRSAIDSLVAQIKKELAGHGVSLAALTVNGETVFSNQEG